MVVMRESVLGSVWMCWMGSVRNRSALVSERRGSRQQSSGSVVVRWRGGGLRCPRALPTVDLHTAQLPMLMHVPIIPRGGTLHVCLPL